MFHMGLHVNISMALGLENLQWSAYLTIFQMMLLAGSSMCLCRPGIFGQDVAIRQRAPDPLIYYWKLLRLYQRR